MDMIRHIISRNYAYLIFDSQVEIKHEHDDFWKNVVLDSIDVLYSAQSNTVLDRNKYHWAAPVMTVRVLLINNNDLKHCFIVLISDKELPRGALELLTISEWTQVAETAREYEALRSRSCFNNCDDDWSSNSKTCTCKANKKVDELLISKLVPHLTEVSDEKQRHMDIITTSNKYLTGISINLHRRPVCSTCSLNWNDGVYCLFNEKIRRSHKTMFDLVNKASEVMFFASDMRQGTRDKHRVVIQGSS
ncbi:hypothetical protein BOW53_16525 [Solemya pervernicosa gill symbiont]|uniref:Uncharacterized protein n=1 Tax=Solemya pervernicosa gill symbiont TaxID=642797 RepID=A0A1T2KZ46_9GAMM|nr:hypothetical protein [Solemya pervernicosa gill symbiont]OOZ38113.1 hypothetical protein BOW53_16525 [Solemya pervernicosa gill symbiont]